MSETLGMTEVNEKKRTIGVTMETYNELVRIGGYDETMDQIVRKCVEAYKREREQTGKHRK